MTNAAGHIVVFVVSAAQGDNCLLGGLALVYNKVVRSVSDGHPAVTFDDGL